MSQNDDGTMTVCGVWTVISVAEKGGGTIVCVSLFNANDRARVPLRSVSMGLFSSLFGLGDQGVMPASSATGWWTWFCLFRNTASDRA